MIKLPNEDQKGKTADKDFFRDQWDPKRVEEVEITVTDLSTVPRGDHKEKKRRSEQRSQSITERKLWT